MKARISGTRDGQDWPAPGETVDMPDVEAVVLLNAGLAAPAPEVEPERAVKPRRRRGD